MTDEVKQDLHAQIMNLRANARHIDDVACKRAYMEGHRDARHAAAELALAALPSKAEEGEPVAPDEDAQWAIDRGADFLEQYAAYIHRVKPEDIEEHPYLPELENVAQQLRALSTWPLYASPLHQEVKELTDEEIVALAVPFLSTYAHSLTGIVPFARAIEQHLRGEKEGKA